MRYYVITETGVLQANFWAAEMMDEMTTLVIDRIKNVWTMDFIKWMPMEVINT